jgi:transcriptional regulator with XRE-family HTH domain
MPRLIVKELAEKQGLNQSQLQMKAGVTPALVNRYWHNKTDSVTLSELGKIADALGVEPGALIVKEEQERGNMSYREIGQEVTTFYVDTVKPGQEVDVNKVIHLVGGSIARVADAWHVGKQRARYLVTLPAGCIYSGAGGNMDPQSITLPGGRILCVYPQPNSVLLAFLPGDSADTTLWDGATRLASAEKEEV